MKTKHSTRVCICNNKNNLVKCKRSQMQISFGMIFSIILIVVFISFAIYVIIKFVNTKKCAETGLFASDLQSQIDIAWNSDETSNVFPFTLPTEIEKICFVNLSKASNGLYKQYYSAFKNYGSLRLNTFFYPIENACDGQQGIQLKHIDINKITENNNPYCINNVKGKINLKIEGYYGKLVVLS